MKKKLLHYIIIGLLLTTFMSVFFAVSKPESNLFIKNVAEKLNLDEQVLDTANLDMVTASAAVYNARSGNWPGDPISGRNTLWLNSYCDTHWAIYMSDGGSGDDKSKSNELLMDQGSSTGDRHGWFRIRVPLSTNMRNAVRGTSVNWKFEADVMGGNPSYTRVTYIMRFFNNSTQVGSDSSAIVWGNYDANKGGTDGTYRYETFSVNRTATTYTHVEILIRVDKTGFGRHMDMDARNMRITAIPADTSNPTISGTSNAFTTSSSITLADSAAGIWKYSINGTVTELSTRVTSRTITLSQGSNTIQVWDNLGYTATKTIKYFNPSVGIRNYTDNTLSVAGGSLTLDGSAVSGSSFTNTGGKTVGQMYSLSASPNQGYYFASWNKTNGATGEYASKNTNYNIVEGDAYNTTIWWNAYFNTITTSDKTVTYNGYPQGVDAPTGLPAGFTYTVTYDGSSTVPKDANTYQAVVKIFNGTEEMGTKTVTLTINKKDAVVKVNNESKIYGEANPSFALSWASGNDGDSFAGGLQREDSDNQNAGIYIINSTLDNPNYLITYIPEYLTIDKCPIIIIADCLQKEYGCEDPELTYQIIGELAYDETSLNGCLVRGEGEAVSEYEVLLGTIEEENPNYQISYVSETFNITGRQITVTVDAGQCKVYGDSDPVFTYEITSGELLEGDSFTGELARANAASENAGVYAILQGSLSLPEYYDITFVGADFEILPRDITLKAEAKTKVYGDSDPVFTWTLTAGSLAFAETSLKGLMVREEGQDIGSYELLQGTLDNQNNPNYNITYVSDYLTITKRPIGIRAEDTQKAYGDTDPVIRYAITSGDIVPGDTLFGEQVREVGEQIGEYTISRGSLDNPNYQISYEGGIFSINKRVVVAAINNATKYYGDTNPVFTINYSNFAYDESIETQGIIAPVVNYGSVGQYTSVGSYAITLSGGQADNYTFDISDTATLTILRKPVTISLGYLEAVYNGMRYSRQAVITGIQALEATQPANLPHGVTYEYSKKVGVWSAQTPNDAGLYTVRVTYTAHNNDNYATTVKEFADILYIQPIKPTLGMDEYVFDFSGYGVEIDSFAKGITTGTAPAGTPKYLFSSDGENYVDEIPENVGVYSVRIIYQPAEEDNYVEVIADFENYITINKVYANIDLPSRNEVYHSSDGISADSVAAHSAVITGVKSDPLPSEEERLAYYYFVDGEWRAEPPIDAGIYPVRVEYTAYPDENYLSTTKEFETGVVISKASIFDQITLLYRETIYNGSPQEAGLVNYSGIPGGSIPRGGWSYEYQASGGGMFTSQLFINAGEYNVRVVYTSTEDDNYASVAKTFSQALVIKPAAPTITPLYFTRDFNGITEAPTLATVSGITGGTAPTGRLSFHYLVDGQWTQLGVRNAGSYTGEVRYQAGGADNYADTTVVFTDIVRIRKVTPEIVFPQARYDYTGEPVEAKNAKVNPRGSDSLTPEGVISYLYFIDEDWTDKAPHRSGSYNVKVVFTAAEDSNYTDHENIFQGAHTILNVRPIIGFIPIVKEYNGEPVSAAGGEYIINDEHGEARGQWLYEYDPGGGYWTNSTPITAGEYAVRVRYYEALSDNYTGTMAEFPQGIIIQPKNIVVAPLERQEKIYNGQMIIGSSILFNRERLIQGNEWTGTLDAGAERNAGTYPITLGTLSAGKNYNIIFTEGVAYRILPKEINLNIPNENYVYDGRAKTPRITANPSDIIRGDTLEVYTIYTGDNLNVGTFVATASINSTNYSLPSEKSATYTIARAVMTDNVFNSYEVRYNGKPHSLKAYVSSGATVTYDAPTTYTERGFYTVNAVISKPNFETVTLQATLRITMGKYNVQVLQPAKTLYYGDPLPTLYSDQDENGKASFAGNQTLRAGMHSYHWTFVPYDDNYEEESGTITLDVKRADVAISLNGLLVQRETDIVIPEVKVYGHHQEEFDRVQITYVDSNGTEQTTFPVATGRYTMKVVFDGDENYAPATYTTVIEIKKDNTESMKLWLYGGIGTFVGLIGAAILINRLRYLKKS